MGVNLVKLCVGVDTPEVLEQHIARNQALGARARAIGASTRSMPKRRDEVLDGGSLFWVMRGRICCRQRIVSIEQIDRAGEQVCWLGLAPDVIRVQPRLRKPFQGWRYLEVADSPADIGGSHASGELPNELREELERLGLL